MEALCVKGHAECYATVGSGARLRRYGASSTHLCAELMEPTRQPAVEQDVQGRVVLERAQDVGHASASDRYRVTPRRVLNPGAILAAACAVPPECARIATVTDA